MLDWQQFKDLIRDLKGRKREQRAFTIATLCLPTGYAVGGKLLPDFKDGLAWLEIAQLVLYAIGVGCLAYTALRLWRVAHPVESPSEKNRPSAIKGPTAFKEGDGALFRKLGRERELRKLLGFVLDNQMLMVIVRGESGAGKTSLLRAGLTHILTGTGVHPPHYWAAVPTESDKKLLRAIQQTWPEGAAKPATLDELVNPSDALGRGAHVIVLAHFEQLRGSDDIFPLLRRIIRESTPPHRITWVIAFRNEFANDWWNFFYPELKREFHQPEFSPPEDLTLELFTVEEAREIIGQLLNKADLSIEQAVINNLLENVTVAGKVSPVDIGIGLLVLEELPGKQDDRTMVVVHK